MAGNLGHLNFKNKVGDFSNFDRLDPSKLEVGKVFWCKIRKIYIRTGLHAKNYLCSLKRSAWNKELKKCLNKVSQVSRRAGNLGHSHRKGNRALPVGWQIWFMLRSFGPDFRQPLMVLKIWKKYFFDFLSRFLWKTVSQVSRLYGIVYQLWSQFKLWKSA